MSIIYAPGVTSKSVAIQIVDDSGLAVTGLVAATLPALTYWLTGANAAVSITLSDLAAITTAYSSGGVKELSGGYYRLDLPNAALASAGKVKVIGEATGKHCLSELIDVSYPQADVRQYVGTTINAPATAGVPDVNASAVNNVSTSSVTTIGANVGTTQPVNFTGTAGSALVQVDCIDWKSGAIPSPNVTGVPLVDVKYLLGTAWLTPGTAGTPDVNVKLIGGQAAALDANNLLKVDVEDWHAQAVSLDANNAPNVSAKYWAGTAITATSIPVATAAGGSGGLLIAGSNAATTFASLTVTTTTTLTGNVSLGGTLGVTGATTLAGLTTGALSCTTITASGAVAFQSTFAVTTSTSLAALSATTITASGTTSLAAVTTSGTVTFNALTITNAMTVSGTTTHTGAVVMSAGLTLTGAAAVTGTPAVAGLTITGGAASTSSGGVAAPAVVVKGGAGAASTNGAAAGATFTGGGTNTVASTASGLTLTGTSIGHGLNCESGPGATGDGIYAASNATAGNGMTLAHSGSAVFDFNATTTPLTLAKTTNITGFNDIAATAIVSSGAITTSGGKVSEVTLVDTVTTVTNQLTAAAIATGVWQDATAGDFTTASSIGKSLYTSGVVPGGSGGLFIAGTNDHLTITNNLLVSGTTTLTGAVAANGGVTFTSASGDGFVCSSTGGNGNGFNTSGNGTGAGAIHTGGATGPGEKWVGGATSGDGLIVTVTSGHGFNVAATGTAKDAMHLVGAAAATTHAGGHGLNATGGAASTSAGGTAGVGVNALGGAGAASTNGAGDGFVSTGGGTTTVSGGNGMTLAHSGAVNDFNATTTPLTLAKTTNITGFNDIAATAIVSSGAITTSGGKVSEVTLVDTATTVTNQLTAAAIGAGVWAIPVPAAFTSGEAGYVLGNIATGTPPTAAAIATAVWEDTLAGGDFGTAGSIGLLLATDIDAKISSASAPTAAQVATAVWQDATAGDFTVSGSIGKSLGGAFTALGTSVFTTAALANAPGGGNVTVGGYAANQDPATLVLDVAAASHNTAGTIGAKINAAGSSADPLLNNVPGAYVQPEAGWVLGQLLAKSITFTGPVNPVTGQISLIRGDDYYAADGRALTFAVPYGSGNPNLTGAAVTFNLVSTTGKVTASVTMAVANPGASNQSVSAELSSVQTNLLAFGQYVAVGFAVLADGHIVTFLLGQCTVPR